MSNNKKDLTRIEDLGEYIHELNQEETVSSEETETELETNPFQDNEASFDNSSFQEDSETSFEDSSNSFENSAFDDSNNNDSFQSDGETSFGESQEFSTSEEITPDFTQEQSDSDFPPDDIPNFELQEPTSALTESISTFNNQEYESVKDDRENIEQIKPSYPSVPLKDTLHVTENFEDLRKFAENTNISGMATEGNPSFSLLIKQVRYIEDVQDITLLLKELNLLQDSEEQIKARLSRGTFLIPRVSEYAAIFLAHKLRRLDIDILVGPSDEIHPPKHQEDSEIGLVSKQNLYQNQSHNFHFTDQKLDLNQIIVSATPQLEGFQVVRYIGVASEHKILESKIVENEDSTEVPKHYSDLAFKLKAHALKSQANAVVGINYQLTPIPSELGLSGHKYRLSCTGNLVWVQRI